MKLIYVMLILINSVAFGHQCFSDKTQKTSFRADGSKIMETVLGQCFEYKDFSTVDKIEKAVFYQWLGNNPQDSNYYFRFTYSHYLIKSVAVYDIYGNQVSNENLKEFVQSGIYQQKVNSTKMNKDEFIKYVEFDLNSSALAVKCTI